MSAAILTWREAHGAVVRRKLVAKTEIRPMAWCTECANAAWSYAVTQLGIARQSYHHVHYVVHYSLPIEARVINPNAISSS